MTARRRWFERDAFWTASDAVLSAPARQEDAVADIRFARERLGLAAGDAVLDVFCGSGRHLVPLLDAGFTVLGVDQHLRSLRRAQRRCAAHGHDTDLRLLLTPLERPGAALEELDTAGDVSEAEMGPIGPVDAALWLGSSTGYVGPAHDVAVLRWIRARLKSGGSLLIEGSTLEDLTDVRFEPWEWFDELEGQNDSPVAAWRLEHRLERPLEPSVAPDGPSFVGRWRRFAAGEAMELAFSYRVYSRPQWRSMLHEANFCNVLFVNALDDDARTARSWIVATA